MAQQSPSFDYELEALGRLADEQAALRRVATLVARGASPAEVFAAVSDELARHLDVVNAGLLRFEADGTGYVVAVRYAPGITRMPVTGEHIPLAGDDVGARVLHTARAARIDNHENVEGPEAARIRAEGIGSIVGVPIVVDGRLWGAAIVGSRRPSPMPADTEARIADFADLVATAISNAATRAELRVSRDELSVLAEQQAALRRVATLVARGAAPARSCSPPSPDEMARCLHTGHAAIYRYADDALVPLAVFHGDGLQPLSQGISPQVGRPQCRCGEGAGNRRRGASGPQRRCTSRHMLVECVGWACIRRWGRQSLLEGRPWGVAVVGSLRPEQLPRNTEARIVTSPTSSRRQSPTPPPALGAHRIPGAHRRGRGRRPPPSGARSARRCPTTAGRALGCRRGLSWGARCRPECRRSKGS